MIYSSYLGAKKCNNVICSQGLPGPRGLPGPIGPTGHSGPFNSFTIISNKAAIVDTSLNWDMNIPFIYGNQFTFTFHTNNSNVTPYPYPYTNVTYGPILTTTNSYISGSGQAVYQPYQAPTTPSSSTLITKYGYIPTLIFKSADNYNFDFIPIIDNDNNTIIYRFIYYINNNADMINYFSNSTIQLDGLKC